MGVTPAGPFDIPEAQARDWMALPLNPNGRPNSDVLRPYFNGMDLTARATSGSWISGLERRSKPPPYTRRRLSMLRRMFDLKE